MGTTGSPVVRDDGERMIVRIQLGDIELDLLPGRVAFRADTKTIFVADMHLGKSGSFRANGVPVPESSTSDVQRLAALVERHDAQRVVVLGDLLHDRNTLQGELGEQIRTEISRFPVPMHLVPGNHDAHTKDLGTLALTIAPEDGEIDGLRLRHEPARESEKPMLSGHVHPVAILGSRGGPHLRARCFHASNQVLTLPAFGSFTGGFVIDWNNGGLFAAGDGEVIPLNLNAKAMARSSKGCVEGSNRLSPRLSASSLCSC